MAAKAKTVTGEPTPLSEVFPGEAVALSRGEPIMVRPWGAHAAIHEIPALLGRLMAKLMPLRDVLQDPASGQIHAPIIAEAASEEIADLVAYSIGFTRADLEALGGADYFRLIRAVLRQNKDFFGEMIGLLRDAAELVPGGFGLSRRSDGQGSPSTNSE